MKRLVLIVVIALAVPAAAAQSASKTQRRGQELVQQTIKRVEKRWPGCRTNQVDATPVRAVVGPYVTAMSPLVETLRRPQTPEEAGVIRAGRKVSRNTGPIGFLTDTLFARGTRIATAASGRRVLITVGRAGDALFTPKAGREVCNARKRRTLRQVTRGESRAVRRAASDLLGLTSDPRPDFPQPAVHIEPYPRKKNAVALGADLFGTSAFRSDGFFVDLFTGSPTARRTDVVGLLPDGVASVTLSYDKGPTYDLPVQQNVVAFTAAVPPTCGRPDVQIWRRADGSVIDRTARLGTATGEFTITSGNNRC